MANCSLFSVRMIARVGVYGRGMPARAERVASVAIEMTCPASGVRPTTRKRRLRAQERARLIVAHEQQVPLHETIDAARRVDASVPIEPKLFADRLGGRRRVR